MMSPYTYQQFINHPFIQKHKNKPKWTVSYTKDKKMPCDMLALKNQGIIRGASIYDEYSLTTLDDLDAFFFKTQNKPPANHTFYLEAVLDNFCVLDIEPSCPEYLKKQLLQSDYIYGEVSLSQKGYHLIFPLPKCAIKYKDALQKPTLKDGDKNYEILLNHFCTFTGNMIDGASENKISFDEIYEKLAKKVTHYLPSNETKIQLLTDCPETDHADEILDLLRTAGSRWRRKPEDFRDTDNGEPDLSRYEWTYAAYLRHKLNSILKISDIKAEHKYIASEQLYFIYTILQETLPYRSKHDEYRTVENNLKLPWLAYLTKNVIEKIPEDNERY